ncbi:MAG: 16S rRNA (guanine(527)-N(7))-methyltransferase RsmG [Nitrospirota bacterium]
MRKAASPKELLIKGFQELSLSYSDNQVIAFMTYLNELKKWNRAYNLTSLKTDEDIIIKHFLDSLLYLKAIPENRLSIMDVGSGAGFPGIPIGIMRPENEIYLIEPSRKKAAFLTHIISTLRIDNVEVVEKRVEDLESMDVDIAVTRALFDIVDFCKKVSPVLDRGGNIILSKGPKVQEELKGIEKEGLDFKILDTRLPLTDIRRFIVIVRKRAGDIAASGEPQARTISPFQPKIAQEACSNAECRLRKAGCRGFQGCPGFKSRA